MVVARNLKDQIFGRLTVISRSENINNAVAWECLCKCGNTHFVTTGALTRGATKSCGCLQKETAKARLTTHGKTRSPEYQSWRGMKERCDNPKNSHYEFYGARGIGYDNDWDNFENFLRDMGQRPEGSQLDRKDVNLGYSKDNCKWSTLTEQAFNIRLKSNNKSGRSGVYLTSQGNLTFLLVTIRSTLI